MRPIIMYTKEILFLLIVVLFIGCSSKESNRKPSKNELTTEEETSPSSSKSDLEKRVDYIENKIDKNLDSIKLNTATIADVEKLTDKLNTKPISLFFLSIVINLIILTAAYFLILRKKLSRHNIINQVLKSKRLEKKFIHISNNIASLEKSLKKIDEKTLLCENEKRKFAPKPNHSKKTGEVIIKENKSTKKQQSTQPIKYLSGVNENYFTYVDTNPDGSFFKIENQRGDIAEYTFHGSDEEAIAKKVFNEQISKTLSGSQKSAKKVEVVTPGKIKQVNNHWEVTQPIEIKLI